MIVTTAQHLVGVRDGEGDGQPRVAPHRPAVVEGPVGELELHRRLVRRRLVGSPVLVREVEGYDAGAVLVRHEGPAALPVVVQQHQVLGLPEHLGERAGLVGGDWRPPASGRSAATWSSSARSASLVSVMSWWVPDIATTRPVSSAVETPRPRVQTQPSSPWIRATNTNSDGRSRAPRTASSTASRSSGWTISRKLGVRRGERRRVEAVERAQLVGARRSRRSRRPTASCRAGRSGAPRRAARGSRGARRGRGGGRCSR